MPICLDPWAQEAAAANEPFAAALQAALTYRGNARAAVERLLASEPGNVFGHCLLLALVVRSGRPAGEADLAGSLAEIDRASSSGSRLPQQHAEAARAWLAGDPHGALAVYGGILEACPRDALALMAAHALDFHLGLRQQLLDRTCRVIRHWRRAMPGYPAVLAMHAFALEECGRYREAERRARQALALDPNLPAAIHVLAHVMEMEGRAVEGLELLAATEACWLKGTGFSVHLAWHRALFYLETDNRQAAIEVYDREIMKGGGMDAAALGDATSLLWRLLLLEFDIGGRWEYLAQRWQELLTASTRPFFATHAMMALLGAGQMGAADQLLGELGRSHLALGVPEHALALPLGEAFRDFVRRDYAGCFARLASVRAISHRCGGSLAQCDVIHLTLTEAALRTPAAEAAELLVAERAALKPLSPINLMLRRRVQRLRLSGPRDAALRHRGRRAPGQEKGPAALPGQGQSREEIGVSSR